MTTFRMWLAFAVLAAYCFGLLGYSFYLTATSRPGTALLVIFAVLVTGKIMPYPLAWLATVGARQRA